MKRKIAIGIKRGIPSSQIVKLINGVFLLVE